MEAIRKGDIIHMKNEAAEYYFEALTDAREGVSTVFGEITEVIHVPEGSNIKVGSRYNVGTNCNCTMYKAYDPVVELFTALDILENEKRTEV